MSFSTPFSDIVVAEFGKRPAVRAAGALLAQLGAKVFTTHADPGPGQALKHVMGSNALDDISLRANVLLTCSDRADTLQLPKDLAGRIICDIVVGGPAGRPAPGEWTEPLLQAATGCAHLTGTSESPPTTSSIQLVERHGALFAAAAVLALWPTLRSDRPSLNCSISLFDCGINCLSTYIPFLFGNRIPKRSGNRHPMAAPWNAYRAVDGWVLLCSATDQHWQKLCDLMGRPELKDGPLAKLADRVAEVDEVDAIVEGWTSRLTVTEAIDQLASHGLAAGPIVPVSQLATEANLAHRRTISVRHGWRDVSFLHTEPALAQGERFVAGQLRAASLPLTGLKVLEIGQYTTAPLATRQMALLGADVTKIEPPEGEASRAWPPVQDGLSYFYVITNSNKQSLHLNLRARDGKATFRRLLQDADVLIENLKPGSLKKLGFGRGELAAINPALIYCSISGFGRNSVYPGRPAFDTVVQAMSGLMDSTPVNGTPNKLGVSAADLSGGVAGLFATVAACEYRRRTGRGVNIDLAMQDVSVWMAEDALNGNAAAGQVVRCNNGELVIDGAVVIGRSLAEKCRSLNCKDATAVLGQVGILAAPARRLEDIGADKCIIGDGAVALCRDAEGRNWPLFRPLIRIEGASPVQPASIRSMGAA